MENNIRPVQVFDFDIYPLLDTIELLKRGKGRNQKKLLVVLKTLDPQNRELAMDLLNKIMKAVDRDLENDLFLLELTQQEGFNFKSLHQQLSFKTMIVLGFHQMLQVCNSNVHLIPLNLSRIGNFFLRMIWKRLEKTNN